ncbi:MAG: hypothetical protein WD096_00135 [Actinomycetota bacterium]
MRFRPVSLIVALAAVSACGAPSNTYVEDPATGVQFAVPAGWQVVDLAQRGTTPDNPVAVPDPLVLQKAFAPGDVDLPDPWGPFVDFPIGYAMVQQLTPEAQDIMSIRRLRNLVIQIDGLLEDRPDDVRIIDQELLSTEGFRGEHLVYSMRIVPEDPQSPPVTVTLDQTAYLDPFTTNAYVFLIGCTADCYVEHADTIRSIASTWSVVPG